MNAIPIGDTTDLDAVRTALREDGYAILDATVSGFGAGSASGTGVRSGSASGSGISSGTVSASRTGTGSASGTASSTASSGGSGSISTSHTSDSTSGSGIVVDSPEALALMEETLSALSTPIQVFDRYPGWRPMGVDVAREPSRSEGTGSQPLHMDFVNAEDPPDLVLLYCARADPAGGGGSRVATIPDTGRLPEHVRATLSEAIFSDGRVVDLHGVGADINPFPVLAAGKDWHVRYTGKLADRADEPRVREALSAFEALLEPRELRLAAGQALLIDQHRALHGRCPLGPGQETIPAAEQRLLWQRFGRTA